MYTILISGLVLGLVSGLHCIGMCGPIAVLAHGNVGYSRILLHNLGRVSAYLMLGALFGYFGQGFVIAGFQGYLSILVGLMLVGYAIVPSRYGQQVATAYTKSVLFPIQRAAMGHQGIAKPIRLATFGAVNGLLPCGMVYMALSLGVATGSPTQSLWLMLGFGIGTLPVMAGFGAIHSLVKKRFPQLKMQPIYAWIGAITGALTIIRGMALEIPYLSPVLAIVGIGQDITICGQ